MLYDVQGVCRCFVVTTKDVTDQQIFYAYYGTHYDNLANNFDYFEKISPDDLRGAEIFSEEKTEI